MAHHQHLDAIQARLAQDVRWHALIAVADHQLALVYEAHRPPNAPGPMDAREALIDAAQESLEDTIERLKAHLRVHYPELRKSGASELISAALPGDSADVPVWLALGRWPPRGRKPEPMDFDQLRRDITNAMRGYGPGEYPGQEELLRLVGRSRENTRRVREWWKEMKYRDYKAMLDDLRPRP